MQESIGFPEFVKVLPEGHPVKVYFEENNLLRALLNELDAADPEEDFQKFFNIFSQVCEVDRRYTRKENQLFPYLEKRGWNGPSQGMWAFHDANRDLLRAARKRVDERDLLNLNHSMHIISQELRRMMMVEETRLFPYALELLSDDDWKEMRAGDEEIGWMLKEAPAPWPPKAGEAPKEKKGLPFSTEGRIRLDEGYLTPEQVGLMLKVIPVDLTYVDENDRVVFYNRGEERVFPRSAGVIGREVRFCHPPKSLNTVLRILEEFRAGTKDQADFWIRYRGKVVHIRYFAVRDEHKNYKGVIEMSQDITEIQKLEGEQRLLNWET